MNGVDTLLVAFSIYLSTFFGHSHTYLYNTHVTFGDNPTTPIISTVRLIMLDLNSHSIWQMNGISAGGVSMGLEEVRHEKGQHRLNCARLLRGLSVLLDLWDRSLALQVLAISTTTTTNGEA